MHEVAPPPRLHSPFWPVIEKCLAKRPTDRFADISEFREVIHAVAMANRFQVPRKAKPEDDFWAYRDQGNTLRRLGKYEEAIAAFDKFLAVLPWDGAALFNRACCIENLGRFKEALEFYQRHVKSDYKACVNSVNCLERLGDHEAAMKMAQRAKIQSVGSHWETPTAQWAFSETRLLHISVQWPCLHRNQRPITILL